MKLVMLSFALVGACCIVDVHGMEYRNKQTSQKLSEADELISKAEKIFETNEMVAYSAGFRTVSSPVTGRHKESVNFANTAKSLVQPIMNRQVLSLQDAQDAQKCLYRINTLLTKIANVKK